MFDAVRNNKKIVQIFLVLITLPFALWGVESYVRDGSSVGEVASVGDRKISTQEFQESLREQQDRLRQQLGGRIDPAMFETPEMRRAVLDSLINKRLLSQYVSEHRLSIADADLAGFIASQPSLQEDGRFSAEKYAAVVASQGMSKEVFEQRLRHDLTLQQAMKPVDGASILGRTAAQRWVQAQLEQRDVAELRLSSDAYNSKVVLADDAVSKFYETNRMRYELPEQVRVEYVSLTQEGLLSQIKVTEEEIKARYASRADNYKEVETRRASHILFRVAQDASEAELKAVQTKAEETLAKVRKTPADFARLAKEQSQDPGSAAKGGDLDWFGRGMMVKPFEETVFALKEGEISNVIRTDFGLHIIRVTGIKAERVKPLAEVRDQIQKELLAEQSVRKFSEAAEGFGNVVYEQSDSLQPAAEKWKLPIKASDWMRKGQRAQAPFSNQKLLDAIFSEDAIKHRRNTEAIEVAPGVLVSARVVEHRPAALQALDVVKDAIRKQLILEEAGKLARKEGEDYLARLAKGEDVKLAWGTVRSVSRAASAEGGGNAARVVFKAEIGKLPAYAGTALPDGSYMLYRIQAVKAAAENDPRGAQLAQQYARLVAEEDFGAWLESLRQRYPVKVNSKALERKD